MHTINVMSLILLQPCAPCGHLNAEPGSKPKVLRHEIHRTALDNRGHRLLMALVIGLLQLLAVARASDAVEVSLVAEVRNEVEFAGRHIARLAPATELQQGQEVFYTVRIANPSTTAARDVVVVQRIPENTTYVPNSAGGPGAEITFSADGGQSFGKEGQLTIADKVAPAATRNRAPSARPATAQEYTHIRWHLRNSLAPGAVALARFRAVFR